MGLAEPDRFPVVILEALHYDRCKPRSREFFQTAAENPRKFGSGIGAAMAREHGDDYWESLMSIHGKAWLDILDNCDDPAQDLYSGRIREFRCPALIIHGSEDPRTEPDELLQVAALLPSSEMRILDGATHSPHSEPPFAEEVTSIAEKFLKRIRLINAG
jgi:pimeloyl-ACP methyl ester carboxylesterase